MYGIPFNVASTGRTGSLNYLDTFERIITRILLVLMAVVVVLATVEVIWVVIKDVLSPPPFLLDIGELLDLFGLFLLVLIGLELLHSVKIYMRAAGDTRRIGALGGADRGGSQDHHP